MAEGCINKTTKYFLFATNFLIFILGLVVLGCGIWVLVDKPSFFDIIDKASDACGDSCDGFDAADISLYTSAGYIMVVISAFVVLVSFFGCCGAWKESKCMLGTYFTIILALFIVMLVGAILGYSGDFEKTIKKPLKDSLKEYNDQPQSDSKKALKSIWNEVQEELKCCGVDGVTDWSNGNGTSFNWESNFNKPEGCCQYKRGDGDKLSQIEINTCRKETNPSPDSTTYYFKGCYTAFSDQVRNNQDLVVGLAIGVVAIMFLNMLFSFSLCMMVKS